MKLNLELKKGASIGIISPCGPVYDRESFFLNIKILEQKGFKVKVFPHALCSNGFLAGSDQERLEDLHAAFLDKNTDIILCSRGGYGAIRLLDKIDYDIIKNNRHKIFIGSSDATAFLAAFYCRAGISSLHALMLLNGFADLDIDKINNLKVIKAKKKHKILFGGEAHGVLWGGNLATIVSLFGARNYLPESDIILFLEDICEPPYKIDRMLMQIFRNHALREKIKGIVFGEFTGISKEDLKIVEKVLFEYAQKFALPCVYGYDITHNKNNIALPFGADVKLFGSKICLL